MTNNLMPLNVPMSQETEEALIGSILINPDCLPDIVAFLKADDFFFIRHRLIWQAFHRLSERKVVIDYVTVIAELEAMHKLDEIGGMAMITQLINATPTSEHAEVYARMIQRLAIRRSLMAFSDEAKALACNEDLSTEDVLNEVDVKFSVVKGGLDDPNKQSFYDMIHAFTDRMEYMWAHPDATMGIPSGIRDLDTLLSGWQNTDSIIVAGRPGMGKSALIASWMLNAAKRGYPVGLWSGEMGREQVIQRLTCMELGIEFKRLRYGKLTHDEFDRFYSSVAEISELPIFIDDRPALNPTQIRAQALSWKRDGAALLCYDYLGLMQEPTLKKQGAYAEISHISKKQKELAKELNVPVITASQLSRSCESRADKRPMLSDLRDSGAVEQDADIVIFVYRDVVYNPNTESPAQTELIIAKHRNGDTGTVFAYFDKAITKFMNGQLNYVNMQSRNG